MTSKAHYFKNAMRVYAEELICSTAVLGFQTLNSRFAYITRRSVSVNSVVYRTCYTKTEGTEFGWY